MRMTDEDLRIERRRARRRLGTVAKRIGDRPTGLSGAAVLGPAGSRKDWQAVVCIASGPSLTEADAELVQQWRSANSNRRVIVTNNTHMLCPWADALAAMDRKWWQHYNPEFAGERFSIAKLPSRYRVEQFTEQSFGCSGTMAIALAISRGASRVVLLGYDCQKSGRKAHWHADHPTPLGNAGALSTWPSKFAKLNRALGDKAQIINATRSTALEGFERQSLEQALESD